jgi:uncharacterized membrane protein
LKIFLNVVAVLFVLFGTGWFLQGINVLPGSVMSGQTQWVINGAIIFVLGVGLLIWNNRRK